MACEAEADKALQLLNEMKKAELALKAIQDKGSVSEKAMWFVCVGLGGVATVKGGPAGIAVIIGCVVTLSNFGQNAIDEQTLKELHDMAKKAYRDAFEQFFKCTEPCRQTGGVS